MKQIYIKSIVITIAFCLFSCGSTRNNETDLNSPEAESEERIFVSNAQFEQNQMKLEKVESRVFEKVIKTNGVIDVPPENRAVVNATMGGYIKTTPLLIGDKVTKNQVLVTVENAEFVSLQQEYVEVKEQLSYLKAEFDRQQTMMNEKITSQKSYLKAESNYKSAVAQYTSLKKQLEMLNILPSKVEQGIFSSVATIYSPISGSITKLNINRGTYVSPASAILEIIDNDHIHLELSVFEKDVLKLKKGQKITFSIPESSDEYYDAEVYLIGTAIEENRTIKVHGHIKNESELNFLTGMYVNAEIVVQSDSVMALPNTAVVISADESVVLVVDQRTDDGYFFKAIKVETGQWIKDFVELKQTSGINYSNQILTKGAFSLVANE